MEIWIEQRDPDSLQAPHLFQSGFWCRFKEKFGWTPLAFQVGISLREGEGEIPLFLHLRTLFSVFSIAYIPFGPDFPTGLGEDSRWVLLNSVSMSLEKELPFPCQMIRFDLPWEKPSSAESSQLKPHLNIHPQIRFYKAPMDIQPPDTVVLDLTQSEEQLLLGMKPKTRYNLRLAMKKGIEVRSGTVEDLSNWYKLYRETAARDRIAIHSYTYYRTLFDLSLSYRGDSPRIALFLASYEGTLIGGIIAALFKDEAIYLYGASSNQHRNVMASYLLQWEAMKWAKQGGARRYDLFGISPTDDPTHPLGGLYRFKTGFGGRILHRWGSWDYPIHGIPYGIYREAERFRYWYHKVFRKHFF